MASRRNNRAALFLFLVSLVLLAACGNRGSLYLPEEDPAESAPAADAPAPVDTQREDADDDEDS